MELKADYASLHIKGNILSVSDFEAIKAEIEKIKSYKNLTLKIYDSLVVNSSLIGYLVKLINQEDVRITIEAGNHTLIELLKDIGLDNTFNLKKLG